MDHLEGANQQAAQLTAAHLRGRPFGCTPLVFMAALLGPPGCGGASTQADQAHGTGGIPSTGGNGPDATYSSGGAESTGGSGSGGATSSGGDFGAERAEVRVDPYGNCPLAAVVNLVGVDPEEVQAFQVVVAGRDGAPDFERRYALSDQDFATRWDSSDLTFAEAGFHVPVLGLYADTESSVQISVERQGGDTVDLS
ncbi:MAG TPA: aryl-sulfate sulfotransferase N-terminal domain-containing protein, partial [Polyangiaceae bacterium]|nr:aryl-sulfate sulfotransferase N-terminal domain-containing protein [Polyangiaceae bacterium]